MAIAQISPGNLADEDFEKSWGSTSKLDFIAVDAQYFSVAMIPLSKQPGLGILNEERT